MTETWGDFSHYRVVGAPLGDPRGAARGLLLGSHETRLYAETRAATPEELALAATQTGQRYFALGYPGYAWKISEGTDYEDLTWRAGYATAVAARRWFMGYHFIRNALSGSAQADWFLKCYEAQSTTADRVTRRAAGLDRFCLDQEDTQTPARARVATLEFCHRMVARGYIAGLIYTGKWYTDQTGTWLNDPDLPAEWRYVWLSDYSAGQADAQIELPTGVTRDRIVGRQYTSTQPGLPDLPLGCDFSRTQPIGWPASIVGGDGDLVTTQAEFNTLMDSYLRSALGVPSGGTPRAMLRRLVAEGSKDGVTDPGAMLTLRQQVVIAALNDPTHHYLQDELQPLVDALTQIKTGVAAQADDETAILGALAAMHVTLTDEQLQELASHVGIDYDKIRQAVQFQVQWPTVAAPNAS